MDVTISIINYNYGRFLSTAIESALVQSVDGVTIEVLVIDDGSTDESDSIIEKYANHQNFRSSKTKNQGFGASLGRAITEANGRYVFLMDADDYFAPDKVSAMLPALQKGNLFVCDTSKYIDVNNEYLSKGMWGSTSTMAVVKAAALPLLPLENELSFYTLYKVGRGIILSESYTYYRMHGGSMTDRKAPGKWQNYLANMTANLVLRIEGLVNSDTLPPWNVDKNKILSVAYEFKSKAYYHQLESALELKEPIKAYKSYINMLHWNVRSGNGITVFNLKMLAKTILMRASRPK
jgi:glycosyltransferase involved in cell wall biosynthesis